MSTQPDDDLFLDDGDGSDTGDNSPEPDESQNLKEVRAAWRREKKQRTQFEKELAELRTFKEQYDKQQREVSVQQAFKDAELNPAHAKLFLALNPDVTEVTADAVKKFAAENALTTVSGDEVEEPVQGFEPPPAGNPPLSGKMSWEDFQKVQREDPIRARKLYEQGRVASPDVPWSTQPFDWTTAGE